MFTVSPPSPILSTKIEVWMWGDSLDADPKAYNFGEGRYGSQVSD